MLNLVKQSRQWLAIHFHIASYLVHDALIRHELLSAFRWHCWIGEEDAFHIAQPSPSHAFTLGRRSPQSEGPMERRGHRQMVMSRDSSRPSRAPRLPIPYLLTLMLPEILGRD